MKPNSLYAQLELIVEPPASQRSGLRGDAQHGKLRHPSYSSDYSLGRVWALAKARLSALGQASLNYFCGSTDLRVTVGRDRQGNPQFIAYDPVSHQRHTFSSEQELRVWADSRYYQ